MHLLYNRAMDINFVFNATLSSMPTSLYSLRLTKIAFYTPLSFIHKRINTFSFAGYGLAYNGQLCPFVIALFIPS